MKIRLVSACALLATGLGLVSAAHAQTNPGFEAGNFTGWQTSGDTLVLGSNLGTGPAEGSFDAFLATATDGSVNQNVPAGQGTDEPTADAFLGLTAGALSGLYGTTISQVSIIQQTFNLKQGQTLTFQWDFLTNQTFYDGTANSYAPDAGNNDFAFLSTSRSGAASTAALADTFYGYKVDSSSPAGFDSGFKATNPQDPFVSETGFKTFSFKAVQSAPYTFSFGVAHSVSGADNGINSALLIDNLQVTPEPATILALGGLCFGMVRKRKAVSK